VYTLSFKALLDEGQNKKLRKEFTDRLSKRIRELRGEKKFTQQELAEKAGLHLTYVGHLELGKYHPTVFVTWKIAKALGVSMNELIDF
jgi:XRE family transcriptional regulator, regulator of sulfur utilization